MIIDLAPLYEQLLGRKPTDIEMLQLTRAVSALNIRENDAMLLVMMALQAHIALCREIPGKIYEVTSEVCTGVKETARDLADAAAAESASKTEVRLADRVMGVVDKVAVRKSWTELVHACVIAGICLAGAFGLGWWGRGNYADVATVATAKDMQAVVDAVRSADDLAAFAKTGVSKQDMSRIVAALKVLDADAIDAAAKIAKNGNNLDWFVNPGKYNLSTGHDKGRKYLSDIMIWLEPKK